MVDSRRSLAVASLLFFAACSTSQPANAPDTGTKAVAANTDADKDALNKAHDVIEGAYRASDCNAMVAGSTSDAVFDPPNSPAAKGTDAIRSWCTQAFGQMKTKTVTVSDKDIEVAGDMGIDRGTYDWVLTPSAGKGPDVHMQGRYISTYKKQSDGTWKMTELMWNSSQPMQAPKA
jgi:ketosteroid isomerase-like protein